MNFPNGNVNFDDPTILARINARSRKQADYKLDLMESLMIKLHQTGPNHGFNEDEGRRVHTKQRDPLLIRLRKKPQHRDKSFIATSVGGGGRRD